MQQQVPQYPNTVALQQVPQDPNTVALQTVQTVDPKQQVVMLPTQSRQPAQQANSQSRQSTQSQASPPSYLYQALYITFILCVTFNVLSPLFGLPAIFFAIMVSVCKN